ncbi:MAG: replication protein RepA [Rhodospirillales bacterium 20-58-10]|nr:MAG: replication protein RepA [Rhodospirillales bacterium 20-58-10]
MTTSARPRTYLEGVTYALREDAKRHGARWDKERRAWYVLGDVPELLADLVQPEPGKPPRFAQVQQEPPEAARGRKAVSPGPTLRRPPTDDAQADFFIPALYDISGKENRSTMDVAVFRLSKKDLRAGALIRYDLSDGYVEVMSGPKGMASVWDYDIVLMAISQLTEAMNRYRAGQGEKPGRRFRPQISEILKFCRKGDGGKQAETVEAALDRLVETRIKIVRSRTSGTGRVMRDVEAGEGLISKYRATSYSDTGKIVSVEIELPDWIYREVVESKKPDVLTVHRDYFLIEQGIARFLYRLARRAAGKGQARWSFRTIFEHSGSAGTFKEFCRILRGIVVANDLPEYALAEDAGQDGPVLAMRYRNGEAADMAAGG